MNRAYLLTGGNLGNRAENLAKALQLINQYCGNVVKASSLYQTAAWGKTDQQEFLNQALQVDTTLNASKLLRCVLKVEKMMGRIRKEKYGPRNIDIDILLFNDEILHSDFLTLPHPQLQNRRFALIPLIEIAPDIIHPVAHKTMTELLNECNDTLEVKKLTG